MLKDNLKYIIIGLSIIIASVIVVFFFPDPNYSLNDCYKKQMKLFKETHEMQRADQAIDARRGCK